VIISEFFEALNSGGICLADNLNLKLDNGAVIHQFNLDKYGLVGYGTPDENHDCDAMGCPTIAHVVWKPD
jgi:hypothetical protein